MQSKISASIEALQDILKRVDEKFWSKKMEKALLGASVDSGSDRWLVDEVKSWFGGMGSISDLVLTHHNGHSVSDDEETEINELFQAELTRLYQLVRKE